MYEKFFGFTEPPFKQTPDPQFFYASPTHEDALSLILHGIAHREGFMVITGEVGTGKTTVCRRLLEALAPGVKAALIPNPGLTTIELLQSVNQEFGIGYAASSKKELGDELSRFLLDNLRVGGGAVLIIDEAQNLSVECLEEIRLLSNLETTKEKLLQIVLVGQPELEDKLRMNELRQLTQRFRHRVQVVAAEVQLSKLRQLAQ
jgi:general secretion pathway protein A